MADSPTERRARTPLPPRQDGKPPATRGGGSPIARAPRFPGGRSFWMIVLGLLILNYVIMALVAPGQKPSVTIPYSPDFLAQVNKGNVSKINSEGTSVSGEFKQEVRYPDSKADPAGNFKTEIPSFVLYNNDLQKTLDAKGVKTVAEPINDGRGFFASLIFGFGPVLLFVALFIWLSRRAAGGQMGALGAFGRSRARRVEGDQTKVTFADVAGIDEAKGELTEVVDFLKNPQKFQRLGGRIPRGVLLAGRPGTGKTLLARAVAGEAGVPFFSISAS